MVWHRGHLGFKVLRCSADRLERECQHWLHSARLPNTQGWFRFTRSPVASAEQPQFLTGWPMRLSRLQSRSVVNPSNIYLGLAGFRISGDCHDLGEGISLRKVSQHIGVSYALRTWPAEPHWKFLGGVVWKISGLERVRHH